MSKPFPAISFLLLVEAKTGLGARRWNWCHSHTTLTACTFYLLFISLFKAFKLWEWPKEIYEHEKRQGAALPHSFQMASKARVGDDWKNHGACAGVLCFLVLKVGTHFILRSYVLVSLGQLFKQSLAIVRQKPRSKPFSLCSMRDIPIYHKNICTRNIEELHCYSLKSMCTQYLIGKKTHPIKFLAPVDILAAKDKHPIFSCQNISIN